VSSSFCFWTVCTPATRSGKPGPKESQLVGENLAVLVKFAKDAVAGKKQMIVTHTEIFPGTFASTTETADYLLTQLGLRRQATLKWGPMQTQQLSEVRKGKFLLVGYAGNSAPDHVDQLHALPEFLKWVEWNTEVKRQGTDGSALGLSSSRGGSGQEYRPFQEATRTLCPSALNGWTTLPVRSFFLYKETCL
jgi:hypothetical protein